MATLTQPLDIILRAIREERSFRKDFSTAADSIVDKVYSFYTNPNCTCKAAIVDWINKNVDVVNTIIDVNKEAVLAIVADIAKAAEVAATAAKSAPPAPPRSAAEMLKNPNARFGNVVDIDRDPEAYKALIVKAMTENWMYRGVTVVPDIVDGKAVWSVFFY